MPRYWPGPRRHAVALRPGRGQICCLDMLRAAVWLASLIATAHAGHSPHWDWDDAVAGRGTPQVPTPPDALAGLAGASSSRVPPPVCPWPSVAAAVNASGGRLSVHLYGTIPPGERRQSGGAPPGEDDAPMINWAINASHLCGGVVFFDQGKVRNPLVFQVLYGPDHLPRQAQDKHKENSKHSAAFHTYSTSCPARSKFPAERHFWAAVGAVPISFRSALKELASGPEGMTGRFSGLERRRRSALRIW
jgi:hypothetical protein